MQLPDHSWLSLSVKQITSTATTLSIHKKEAFWKLVLAEIFVIEWAISVDHDHDQLNKCDIDMLFAADVRMHVIYWIQSWHDLVAKMKNITLLPPERNEYLQWSRAYVTLIFVISRVSQSHSLFLSVFRFRKNFLFLSLVGGFSLFDRVTPALSLPQSTINNREIYDMSVCNFLPILRLRRGRHHPIIIRRLFPCFGLSHRLY